MSRASSSSSSALTSAWAGDLLHPLPLAAVALLAVNDHLLKGSGLLPGWLTGKLSDFAGLFFFPILLVTLARGAVRLATGRDIDDRWVLASAASFVTGAVFTAVKLCPPFNAWIEGVWGVMSLDATDLFALPVIPLSAAFLLRASARLEANAGGAANGAPAHARRFLEFAAVLAAGLASAATSQARPPSPPPPPPPVEVAQADVAVAQPSSACAALTVNVCERSTSGTFVVAKVTGVGSGSCELDIAEAVEIAPGDGLVSAEMLPARIKVKESDGVTFSLSFLRPVDPARITEDLSLRLQIREVHADGDLVTTSVDLSHGCAQR